MIEDELGAANMPDADPVGDDQQREGPVREVDRQQHQADEARAEHEHPAGGEAAGAEAVGEHARRRAGDQEAAVSGSR